MRTMRVLVALSLLLGSSGIAFAACPQGMVLKKVGNFQDDDANISAQGQDIHGVNIDCSGTACTAGFYNADGTDGATNANLTFEAGGAANATSFIDLTESPLYFSEGVTFVDDANVDAAGVYSCQPR